ncbi:MAG TPA: glucosaminidase domain-containing protein [Bacteroidia bacterium]|nr:glucosaminidase domain-containing protein [Bacteroidia bacterium]HQF29252.1 glucosaminidase domain-containing protein [Bacteroidia bacterium]HQK97931.1 glucosaminidase domain-containing protein [Bacteroidia bacterium]
MKNLRFLLLAVLCIFTSVKAQSDTRMTPEEYIAKFKDAALQDMKKTGVPASITMAQGMYESDYGNSPLAKEANNHFGVKCHNEWNGPTYHQDDDAPNECFRKYKSVLESYDDHSNFLRSRDRYKSLFELDITDYKGWAHGLKKAGYATNPQYAHKLIDLIERYNLSELDKGGNPMPVAKETTEEKPRPHRTPIKQDKISPTRPAVFNNFEGKATINKVPFVKVEKGDSYLKISRQYNLELWQILDFNEADKNDLLHEGDIVFLKAKKARAEVTTYTVKEGDTMRSIAQQFGVKQKKIYQMNKMEPGTALKTGQTLQLRKTVIFGIAL